MTLFEAIRSLRSFTNDIDKYAEPRRDSRIGAEVELAVKAAQEDVCANIDLAITVVLVATECHWAVCVAAGLLTAAQFAEATKREIMLRYERAKRD